MALSQLLLKALASLQQTNTLVTITIMATMTNILADLIFVHLIQGRGLALGTTLAQGVYALGLGYKINNYLSSSKIHNR